jgi:hypothetical protein
MNLGQVLCLTIGIGIYVFLHFTTGDTVAPISDDFRQIKFTKSMDSLLDCFQPESFGMFRPVKSLLFYTAYKWDLGHRFFQYFGAVMAVFSCLLTWRVLCKIFGTGAWACFAALLWLYSPLNVVIFNWASALNVSVYYFFALLAIFLTSKMSEPTGPYRRYIYLSSAILAYIAALFSYEMALSIPPLLGLYLIFFRGKTTHRQAYITLFLALVSVTIIFLLTRSLFLTGSTDTIPENSLIGASKPWVLSFVSSLSYFEHLRFLFWPFHGFQFLISLDPKANVAIAGISWALIFLLLIIGLKLYARFPFLLFALLWSAIALAPVLNFIPIGVGPIAEYYMPLAAFGWVVCMTAVLRSGVERFCSAGHTKSLAFALATLTPILLFGREVALRQQTWQSEETLYAQLVERGHASPQVTALLAQIRLAEGNQARALDLAEQAMLMAPEKIEFIALYLNCLKPTISAQKMGVMLSKTMEVYPDAFDLLLLWGDWRLSQNDLDGASQAYEKAYAGATTKGDQASALNSKGILDVTLKDYQAAADIFAHALRIKPYDSSIRANWRQACEDAQMTMD